MSKSYRVHIHDHADQGRWLAQADFAKRPLPDEIEAALPVLSQPGRYEVRISVVQGDNEYHLAGWLQGEYVKDPSNPTDAELSAAIERGLADGSLVDAGEWLAANKPEPEPKPAQTYLDIDRTLAFTALLELDPGFRKMTVDESTPVIAELAEAMTKASPKDRWAFAKAHIEHRLTGCPDCGCTP